MPDGIVFPQDEGTGLADGDEADFTSGGHFAGLAGQSNNSDYVEAGLVFTVNFTDDLLDIGSGLAFIIDEDGATVQDQNGDYTQNWDGPVNYAVQVNEETGIALTADDVNHVFLAFDPSESNSPYYEVNTSGDAPTDPSLKIGEVDTAEESSTEQNRAVAINVSGVNDGGPLSEGDGIERRIWVIESGADDPEEAEDEDLIFEEDDV